MFFISDNFFSFSASSSLTSIAALFRRSRHSGSSRDFPAVFAGNPSLLPACSEDFSFFPPRQRELRIAIFPFLSIYSVFFFLLYLSQEYLLSTDGIHLPGAKATRSGAFLQLFFFSLQRKTPFLKFLTSFLKSSDLCLMLVSPM